MKLCSYFVVILSGAVLMLAEAREISSSVENKLGDNAGAFSLMQSWPETICYSWQHYEKGSKNCSKVDNKWFVFEFTPLSPEGGIEECKGSVPFDLKEIAAIKAELEAKWHPYDANENINEMYKRVWETQGVCTGNKHVDTAAKFFSKGLELANKYNVDSILKSAKVIPGKKYSSEMITGAFSKVVTHDAVQIRCYHDPKTNEPYLVSVIIWFNKDFQPTTNLWRSPDKSLECPEDVMVMYPDSTMLIKLE